ncbi:hypothetical protein BC829DRAFT_426120 [Chytridium lagenaria]|nr:hypothetical protein BC829DRAFT_426120 [Chytridium lagenaria]
MSGKKGAPAPTPRNNAIPSAHSGGGVSVGVGSRLKHARKPRHLLHHKRFYFSTFVALALPFIASDWIPKSSFLGAAKEKLRDSFGAVSYLPSGFQFVLLAAVIAAIYFPFLKKKANGVNSEEHQNRLEAFYEGQADIYDVTRRRFSPSRNFDRVYLVDITPSLCKVAEERFKRLGWTNVKVVCMDATKFAIPKEDGEDIEIALITMSYSLSMMSRSTLLLTVSSPFSPPLVSSGVSDFYISPKRSSDPTRQLSWLMRWFWSIWFDLDNIYLHHSRRDYLEHKFKTVKSLNCKNPFVKPLVYIPYYVWIGAQKGAELPALTAANSETVDTDSISGEEEEEVEATVRCSLIPRFSTYIYAFTWEDPRVDLEYLDLKRSDKMLVITSGGCNVLEYAVKVGPQRIHCVDLNPCQNNMLELKLAGLSGLQWPDFWRLFGEGSLPNFSAVLDTHFSPHLSPFAYHFWKETANFKSLFKTGCSGLAIRVFQFVVRARGLQPAVERMCNSDTIEEQWSVWEKDIRPHFLSKWLIMLLNNDRFLWGALGVPPAQMQMLLEEGSAYDYVVNTLDPVVRNTHLRDDNYFYYMPLMMKYHPNSVPAYLTEEGFNLLQSDASRLDAIRIHTATIVDVLTSKIPDGDLTKVILMDHLDWFSNEDADHEISTVAKKMAKGGRVFWRSAGKFPWYNSCFEKHGFRVYPCQVREDDTMYIDRVNMYASFWAGEKIV